MIITYVLIYIYNKLMANWKRNDNTCKRTCLLNWDLSLQDHSSHVHSSFGKL